jgi:hypothetical protein
MEALAYKQRPRPFSGEVLYALTDDTLFVDNGRKQETIPLSEIVALRLTFGYRNISTAVYMARLRRTNGRTVTLSNLNWRGYVDYDSQDKGYSIFVRELMTKIAKANPRAVFQGGRPALAYIATALVGLTALGGFVAATIWGLMRGNWLLATMGVLFMFPFGKQVHGMITRNRPLLFKPNEPPPALLPETT